MTTRNKTKNKMRAVTREGTMAAIIAPDTQHIVTDEEQIAFFERLARRFCKAAFNTNMRGDIPEFKFTTYKDHTYQLMDWYGYEVLIEKMVITHGFVHLGVKRPAREASGLLIVEVKSDKGFLRMAMYESESEVAKAVTMASKESFSDTVFVFGRTWENG